MSRQRPEATRQRRLGLWLALAALASAAFLALSVPDKHGSDAGSLSVLLADGTLEHDNSRDGTAILTASGIWPGWSGDGDVTITNTGSAGSWLRLTQVAVDDLPGPAGGQLSEQLDLLVEDVTVPGFAVPVYTGPLGSVGEQWLGRMEPGDERTYRFHTEMPSGAGDNDYQASAVSVRFEWAVSDTDPEAEPPTDPPPTDPPPTDPPPADPPGGDQPSGGGSDGGSGDSEPPAAVEAPAGEPEADDAPANDPPADEPPIVVVPEDDPVIVINRRKLELNLAVPVTQQPLRNRKLRVLVSCSRSCRARLRGGLGRRARAARRHRFAGASRALAAGTRTRVTLKIRRRTVRKARRRLARGRTVPGRVKLVARDSRGRKVKAVQRIRLVSGKRR